MTLLVILALVLLVAVVLVNLVDEIRHDGLGHRQPPASHYPYFSARP